MIFLLFIFFASVLFIFRRRISKRRFIYIVFLVLLVASYYAVYSQRLTYSRFILIRNEPANFIRFSTNSKYELIKKSYNNIYPIYISDESDKDKKVINISEEDNSISFPNLIDVGIDTVILSNDSTFFIFKIYSGKIDSYFVRAYSKDNFVEYSINGCDTQFIFYKTIIDSLMIISKDDNPYNNEYFRKNEIKILLVFDKYDKYIQNITFELNGLFDSTLFYSSISRRDSNIAVNEDYDAIISFSSEKINNSDIPVLNLDNANMDRRNYTKVSNFIKDGVKKGSFIKNPFSKKNNFGLNLKSRLLNLAFFESPLFVLFMLIMIFLLLLF